MWGSGSERAAGVQDIMLLPSTLYGVSPSLKLQFRRVHQFPQLSRSISSPENVSSPQARKHHGPLQKGSRAAHGDFEGWNNHQQGGGVGGMMQEAERFIGSNNDNSGNMGGGMDRQRVENMERTIKGGDTGGGQQPGWMFVQWWLWRDASEGRDCGCNRNDQ